MEQNQLYFKKSTEWRTWLKNNHNNETLVWLVFYKKNTGKPTMNYESAVEEALCFGWIDSIIKKIDGERFVRKFTPRKDNSNWSEYNKRRVADLIKNNRMTKFGQAKIDIAKTNGQWDKVDKAEISVEALKEFQIALNKNLVAKTNFEKLAQSHKKQYLLWISDAKRLEIQKRRINQTIVLLQESKKLGLK